MFFPLFLIEPRYRERERERERERQRDNRGERWRESGSGEKGRRKAGIRSDTGTDPEDMWEEALTDSRDSRNTGISGDKGRRAHTTNPGIAMPARAGKARGGGRVERVVAKWLPRATCMAK